MNLNACVYVVCLESVLFIWFIEITLGASSTVFGTDG